jgi:hypothetical protein
MSLAHINFSHNQTRSYTIAQAQTACGIVFSYLPWEKRLKEKVAGLKYVFQKLL